MNLTASQRSAIEHTGGNLLVAASAGSGKTQVLAERVAWLLTRAAAPVSLDRLLVVTFTRAAAGELRGRVARMLREALAQTHADVQRAHLRRQQLLLETAEIGTIDAWCRRVLVEHFAAAGVDPEFSLLSEESAALLRAGQLDALFEWLYGAAEPTAQAAREWIARHTRADDEFLRARIVALNRAREHLVNPLSWLAAQRARAARPDDALRRDAQVELAARLQEECEFQLRQLAELRDTPALADDAALAEYAERLGEWGRAVRDPRQVVQASAAIAEYTFPTKARNVPRLAVVEEVKQRWFRRRLKEDCETELISQRIEDAPRAAERLATLIDLEALYHERLKRTKRARRVLEFADVLRVTLDLLGRPDGATRVATEVALKLRRRYEHVLVDEYQDTSPVQVEILRLVSREEPAGNRFLVGDLKQSIYGFREAEPRLFAQLTAEWGAGGAAGRVQPLADNFRSHPALLDGINGLFAELLHPELGGTAFGPQEHLRGARREAEGAPAGCGPRIFVRSIDATAAATDLADEELERSGREALWAAREIGALLRQELPIPEKGGDGRVHLRPIRLSDIVILLRAARGNASRIAAALRRCGIACVNVSRDSALDALEVGDVQNVLRLLVNRRQDLPLAAYLRGPFVEMTPTELLTLRGDARRGAFFSSAMRYRRQGGDPTLRARLTEAFAQLERWSAAARVLDLPTLIRQIVSNGALRHLARGLRDGAFRVAQLDALQRMASAFAGGGSRGVGEFVEFLEALEHQQVEPITPFALPAEAVRIMTIHAAKGLEFPVVFLLNAGARFGCIGPARALYVDAEIGIAQRSNDHALGRAVADPGFPRLRTRQAARELGEELRLLYVAATRACERLYIVGHGKAKAPTDSGPRREAAERLTLLSRLSANSMLEWVQRATAAAGLHRAAPGARSVDCAEVPAHELAAPGAGKPARPSAAAPLAAEAQSWCAAALDQLARPLDLRLARTPAALSVSAIKAHLADAEHDRSRAGWVSRMTRPHFARPAGAADPRATGTAAHRVLQFAQPAELTSPERLELLLARLVADGRLTDAEAARVSRDGLLWFSTTDEARLWREHAATAQREAAFSYGLPVADGPPTLVRGYIDLLVPTPDGLLLVDYKTDAVTNEGELAERVALYTPQVQVYAHAATAILKQPLRMAALVFLHVKAVVPIAAATLDTARLFAAAAARGLDD